MAGETDGRVTADGAAGEWLRVLEELEAELVGVEVSPETSETDETGVSTGSTNSGWTAPGDIGPIPHELQERARRLLEAQRELISELERERYATAAQLDALRRVPTARPTGASVYLDVVG
jgi:hypothetical protein